MESNLFIHRNKQTDYIYLCFNVGQFACEWDLFFVYTGAHEIQRKNERVWEGGNDEKKINRIAEMQKFTWVYLIDKNA